MGSKLKTIGVIVGAVIVIYIILTVAMPTITNIVDTTSDEIADRPELDHYVGAKEGLDFMPILLYAIPGVIGLISIVVVLRQPEEGG